MTVGNFIKKGIMPLLLIGILTWLGQYIYMEDGCVDWFRFILVYGIPAFCVIVGALFGFVLAAVIAVRAVWYVTMFPISCLVRHREGRNGI